MQQFQPISGYYLSAESRDFNSLPTERTVMVFPCRFPWPDRQSATLIAGNKLSETYHTRKAPQNCALITCRKALQYCRLKGMTRMSDYS